MNKSLTKQLSTIITLKGGTSEDVKRANSSFIDNVAYTENKIDVFQDLDSFLDIALENQDIYDKDKISALKHEMNSILDMAAKKMSMAVIYDANNPLRRKAKLPRYIEIPDESKLTVKQVLEKMSRRGREAQKRATKVLQAWRMKKILKKIRMEGSPFAEKHKASSSTLSSAEIINSLREQLKECQERNLALKAQLGGSAANEKLRNLLDDLEKLKRGIETVAVSVGIPKVNWAEPEEENEGYVRMLNLVHFEVEGLKQGNGGHRGSFSNSQNGQNSEVTTLELNFKKALNEIVELKTKLKSADNLISELSEARQTKGSKSRSNQHAGSHVRSSGLNESLGKESLVLRVEELEETCHNHKADAERTQVELFEMKERVRKYESQLNYFKNNNALQSRELEHLRQTKALYESAIEELQGAEKEIAGLKKEVIELAEFRRKYERVEIKLRELESSRTEAASHHKTAMVSPKERELKHELKKAEETIKHLRDRVDAYQARESVIIENNDQGELERLYLNSQREIEDLNNELKETWRLARLNEAELLQDKNKRSDGQIARLEKKLELEGQQIGMLRSQISDLEEENRRLKEIAKRPRYDSEQMMEIYHKIEDSKQEQRLNPSSMGASQVENEHPGSENNIPTGGQNSQGVDYVAEIRSLKNRLNKAEKENKNLKLDVKAYEFRFVQSAELKNKVKRLTDELEKTKNSLNAAKDQAVHRSKLKHLEKQNDRFKKKINYLENQNGKLRETELELTEELDRLIKEREAYRTSRPASMYASKVRLDPKQQNQEDIPEEDQNRGIDNNSGTTEGDPRRKGSRSDQSDSSKPKRKKSKKIRIHTDHKGVDMNAKPIGQIQLDELNLTLEQENTALRDELGFMTRLKDKFAKNLNETRKELVYAQEERDEAVKRREEVELEIEEAYIEIEKYEEEKKEFIRIIEDLRAQLKNLTEYELEIENWRIKIQILTDENDQLTQKIEIYLEQIEALKMRLTELSAFHKKTIDSTDMEYKEMVEEVNSLKLQLTETEVKLTEEIRYHKETQIRLDESISRCEDLSKKCLAALAEITSLKQQLEEGSKQPDEEFERLQNLIQQYEKQVGTRNEEILALTEFLEQTKIENGQLGTKNNSLLNEIKTLRQEIEHLKEQSKVKVKTEFIHVPVAVKPRPTAVIHHHHHSMSPNRVQYNTLNNTMVSHTTTVSTQQNRTVTTILPVPVVPPPPIRINQVSVNANARSLRNGEYILEKEEWKKVKTYTLMNDNMSLNGTCNSIAANTVSHECPPKVLKTTAHILPAVPLPVLPPPPGGVIEVIPPPPALSVGSNGLLKVETLTKIESPVRVLPSPSLMISSNKVIQTRTSVGVFPNSIPPCPPIAVTPGVIQPTVLFQKMTPMRTRQSSSLRRTYVTQGSNSRERLLTREQPRTTIQLLKGLNALNGEQTPVSKRSVLEESNYQTEDIDDSMNQANHRTDHVEYLDVDLDDSQVLKIRDLKKKSQKRNMKNNLFRVSDQRDLSTGVRRSGSQPQYVENSTANISATQFFNNIHIKANLGKEENLGDQDGKNGQGMFQTIDSKPQATGVHNSGGVRVSQSKKPADLKLAVDGLKFDSAKEPVTKSSFPRHSSMKNFNSSSLKAVKNLRTGQKGQRLKFKPSPKNAQAADQYSHCEDQSTQNRSPMRRRERSLATIKQYYSNTQKSNLRGIRPVEFGFPLQQSFSHYDKRRSESFSRVHTKGFMKNLLEDSKLPMRVLGTIRINSDKMSKNGNMLYSKAANRLKVHMDNIETKEVDNQSHSATETNELASLNAVGQPVDPNKTFSSFFQAKQGGQILINNGSVKQVGEMNEGAGEKDILNETVPGHQGMRNGQNIKFLSSLTNSYKVTTQSGQNFFPQVNELGLEGSQLALPPVATSSTRNLPRTTKSQSKAPVGRSTQNKAKLAKKPPLNTAKTTSSSTNNINNLKKSHKEATPQSSSLITFYPNSAINTSNHTNFNTNNTNHTSNPKKTSSKQTKNSSIRSGKNSRLSPDLLSYTHKKASAAKVDSFRKMRSGYDPSFNSTKILKKITHGSLSKKMNGRSKKGGYGQFTFTKKRNRGAIGERGNVTSALSKKFSALQQSHPQKFSGGGGAVERLGGKKGGANRQGSMGRQQIDKISYLKK